MSTDIYLMNKILAIQVTVTGLLVAQCLIHSLLFYLTVFSVSVMRHIKIYYFISLSKT